MQGAVPYFCCLALIQVASTLQLAHQTTSAPQTNGVSKLCHAADSNSAVSRRDFVAGGSSILAGVAIWSAAPGKSSALFGSSRNVIREEDVPTKGFVTENGIKYYEVLEGTGGPAPVYGQVISFDYTLYVRPSPGEPLVRIESTLDRRGGAYVDKHGSGRTIFGLEDGIHTMKVGGLRRVVVPADRSYVVPGLGPIPPEPGPRRKFNRLLDKLEERGGELVFDVELRRAFDDEADQGYYQDDSYTLEQVQEYSRAARQGTPVENAVIF